MMCKRILALFLILVLVFTASGCDLKEIVDSISNKSDYTGPTEFEQYEVRSVEEIMKEGIKPEDVFALYDAILLKSVRAINKKLNQNAKVQFEKIAPDPVYIEDVQGIPDAYYWYHERAVREMSWLDFEESSYYQPNRDRSSIEKVYCIGIYFYSLRRNMYTNEVLYYYVSKPCMENLFDAFNVTSFNVTEAFIDSQIGTYGENWRYSAVLDLGKQVYNFVFDKTTIQNANEEQLWALYNLVDNIDKINFLGIDPYIYEQEK